MWRIHYASFHTCINARGFWSWIIWLITDTLYQKVKCAISSKVKFFLKKFQAQIFTFKRKAQTSVLFLLIRAFVSNEQWTLTMEAHHIDFSIRLISNLLSIYSKSETVRLSNGKSNGSHFHFFLIRFNFSIGVDEQKNYYLPMRYEWLAILNGVLSLSLKWND